MLAFIGLSLLEFSLLIPLILLLGWATDLDRRHKSTGAKWLILTIGFIGYCIYYAITAGPGDWFPPVFSKTFWTSSSTYAGIAWYVGIGIVYAIVELVSNINDEKGLIRARWNAALEADEDLKAFVNGKGEVTVNSKAWGGVQRFCNNWGNYRNFVFLKTHELERVPQPQINYDAVKDNVFPWIALWPGYFVSMLIGRWLDRLISAINSVFRALGQLVVRVLFRNTFSDH